MLAAVRRFFSERGVLEVETPVVVNAAVTDVHLDAARVQLARASGPYFLHPSPEYAMKRLLASGSGDIYQVCHVVRGSERGKQHNPEFTLIEWYRLGYSLEQLMEEVETLLREVLGEAAPSPAAERLSYRDAFVRHLGLDPFSASIAELAAAARDLGFASGADAPRDEWLELLQGAVVGPRLGQESLTFIYGFPAAQAALARLDPRDPRTAMRFELYCRGLELANGFCELTSAAEQRTRFELDNAERRRRGREVVGVDERLLAALEAGLPDCAGVALGFDRTVMLGCGLSDIDEVLSFPIERA